MNGEPQEPGRFLQKFYYNSDDQTEISPFKNQHWSLSKNADDDHRKNALKVLAFYKDKNDWLRMNTCDVHD